MYGERKGAIRDAPYGTCTVSMSSYSENHPPMPRGGKRPWNSEARASPEFEQAARQLGARVRELRLRQRLTQEALAREAALDPKHVQLIEYGRTNTTVATLTALARALGVPMTALFEPPSAVPPPGGRSRKN